MRRQLVKIVLAAAVGTAGCASRDAVAPGSAPSSRIQKRVFGEVEGKTVWLFTLTNTQGMIAKITNYGAILTEFWMADRDGRKADIVLGFDTLDGYLAGHPYFGAIVGRCANRIAHGRFTLDGKTYTLAANNGPHHLHGGVNGFDKHVWDAKAADTAEGPSVSMFRTSPDGEEGYPGTVQATVTYTLTDSGELRIEMTATTDRPTIVNLAHHSYWNLAGHDSGDILGHVLQINAERFTPTDETLIPYGTTPPVEGTPYDFRRGMAVGADIDVAPGGYDLNFILNGKPGELRWAARLRDPKSGREMEILTTEPGLQFYSGNFLDGTIRGKGGTVYQKHQGLCLETQRYPDSIHRPDWPSVVLRPGETYRHLMIHRFAAK